MNNAQLIAIVTDKREHVADATIFEPMSKDLQVVDSIKRLITNAFDGKSVSQLDLGKNSFFAFENDGVTLRFKDRSPSGNSRPMIEIIPRPEYRELITGELGVKLSKLFVRKEDIKKAPSSKPDSPKP